VCRQRVLPWSSRRRGNAVHAQPRSLIAAPSNVASTHRRLQAQRTAGSATVGS
jgi:hypothetical protein